MSYADYQGVKHDTFLDMEVKIATQKRVLSLADAQAAIGPLLARRASDLIDKDVPFILPGLSTLTPRPARKQMVALSFGRFEAKNDRIKQIQLAAEGFAEACRRAHAPGGPASLRDNPQLKLIGVSNDETEAKTLRRAMQSTANRIINLRPLPYQNDETALTPRSLVRRLR